VVPENAPGIERSQVVHVFSVEGAKSIENRRLIEYLEKKMKGIGQCAVKVKNQ
jgi:hypothetical protein